MQVFTDNTPAREYFKAGSGIVTLCGSTKFFKECMDANRWLTFNNWMVLACGSWGHSYHKGEAVDADHPHIPPNRFENLKRYDDSIQRLRSYYGG